MKVWKHFFAMVFSFIRKISTASPLIASEGTTVFLNQETEDQHEVVFLYMVNTTRFTGPPPL